MLTVDQAILILQKTSGRADIEITNEFIGLLQLLKKENDHLKSAMSEIRKYTTGTSALDVALAKIKELEDKQCDCKQKALEVLAYLEIEGASKDSPLGLFIREKFNLGV